MSYFLIKKKDSFTNWRVLSSAMTPCSPVEDYRTFWGMCYLYIHNWRINQINQTEIRASTIIFYYYYLVCEAIGTAATPTWPIVPTSGDSEDDCWEADGM
jgi:hypothetical protein